MTTTLSPEDAFIATRELGVTASRLQIENSAVLKSFGDRPLTTQYQTEVDGRNRTIEALTNTMAFIEAAIR